MTTDSTLIESELLGRFTASLFQSAGVSDSEASLIASSLVDANLCGHESHGVVRVSEYIALLRSGSLKPGVDLKVISETPALLVCDALSGFGQIQMRRVIDKLIPKAESVGLACGTVRNCGHV
ncbi:MAG: Ldh family oxidoreductase, partial [Planctomycetaceae bacterium]